MSRQTEERLYLNADRSKVVPEGPDAAFLWKAQGDEITDDEARQYGLDVPASSARRAGAPRRGRLADEDVGDSADESAAESIDEEKAAAPDEDKAVEQGADKSIAPKEDKSA